MAIAIPSNLICPITHKLIADPVVAEDGHTYEREAIQQWFDQSKANLPITSPFTRAEMKSTALFPNQAIKSMCLEFLEAHPEVRDSDEFYLPDASVNALYQALLIKTNDGDKKALHFLDKDKRLLKCVFPQCLLTPFHFSCEIQREVSRLILQRLMAHHFVEEVAHLVPTWFDPAKLHSLFVVIVTCSPFVKAEAEALLKTGADLQCEDICGWNLLHEASKAGNVASVSWLLSKGFILTATTATGLNAFAISVIRHHLPLVRYFLQQVNANEKRALVFTQDNDGDSAISNLLNAQHYTDAERHELVPLFLGNPSFAGLPILHVAIRLRDEDLLDKIMCSFDNAQNELPGLIEQIDNQGYPPLLSVVLMESDWDLAIGFAKTLLFNNANPMARVPATGATCFHIAMSQRHVAMVELLISYEPEDSLIAEAEDNFGNTPLHALVNSTVSVLAITSDAGKKAKEIDSFVLCLCRFIESGGNVDQTNHECKTAFDLLKEAGHPRLASMIPRAAFTFTKKQIAALKAEVRQLRAEMETTAQFLERGSRSSPYRFIAEDIEQLQLFAK